MLDKERRGILTGLKLKKFHFGQGEAGYVQILDKTSKISSRFNSFVLKKANIYKNTHNFLNKACDNPEVQAPEKI